MRRAHELTSCQLLQVLWVGGLFANIAACTVAAILLFLPSLRLYGIAILSIQVSLTGFTAMEVSSYACIAANFPAVLTLHRSTYATSFGAHWGHWAVCCSQAALIAYPLCEPPAWGRRVLSFSIQHGVSPSSTKCHCFDMRILTARPRHRYR